MITAILRTKRQYALAPLTDDFILGANNHSLWPHYKLSINCCALPGNKNTPRQLFVTITVEGNKYIYKRRQHLQLQFQNARTQQQYFTMGTPLVLYQLVIHDQVIFCTGNPYWEYTPSESLALQFSCEGRLRPIYQTKGLPLSLLIQHNLIMLDVLRSEDSCLHFSSLFLSKTCTEVYGNTNTERVVSSTHPCALVQNLTFTLRNRHFELCSIAKGQIYL